MSLIILTKNSFNRILCIKKRINLLLDLFFSNVFNKNKIKKRKGELYGSPIHPPLLKYIHGELCEPLGCKGP